MCMYICIYTAYQQSYTPQITQNITQNISACVEINAQQVNMLNNPPLNVLR